MKAKLLFTGAGGFLGRNSVGLLRESYDVVTCGLSATDAVRADLSREIPALDTRFDVVVHAAGKAHSTPHTPEEAQEFFDLNLSGTRHLCDALDKTGVPADFIFISTVAVYGRTSGEMITEDEPLRPLSPYAESKLGAEEYLRQWAADRGVVLTILRPSLIIGENPPGNLGAMIRAIRSGLYFDIAGGRARKSVFVARDLGRLVPLVCGKGGIFNVCSSEPISIGELSRAIASRLGKRTPLSVPLWAARIMARAGDLIGKKSPFNNSRLRNLTSTLTFSNARARTVLAWKPTTVDLC